MAVNSPASSTRHEQGFQQREIEDSAYRHATSLEKGDTVVVGVNRFVAGAEPTQVLAVEPALENDQKSRLEELRATRDPKAVDSSLDAVRGAARGHANLLPPMRHALIGGATVGEVSDALRDVFDTYRPT